MKRLVFGFLFILSIASQAQKNEISVGYSPVGMYSTNDGESYSNIVGTTFAEFYREIKPWVKVGFCAGFDAADETISYYGYSFDSPRHDYVKRNTVFFWMTQARFDFLRTEMFKMGAGLSFGFYAENSEPKNYEGKTQKDKNICLHFNILEVAYGKKYGIKANMGLGAKGLASFGLFYKW